MRLLHLYRPRVPSLRAQAIQVVHSCEALARRGHQVTLLADRADTGSPEIALERYGLGHPPSFDLKIAPVQWPPGAGLWFRMQLAQWCRQPGIVYARAKRYVARIPSHIPVVLEAHEVDSCLDQEAGRDPRANFQLEQQVLKRVSGVVTNCEGTLALLEATHRLPAHRRVIHNATHPSRVVARQPSAQKTVGYTGSPRNYKGLEKVFASLSLWPEDCQLMMVGGAPPDAPAKVQALPPVPYPELPAVLAQCHVLLLPLDDNLFGRQLTSPLKLWDYLATGIPIVAADLPTTRIIGGDDLFYYDVHSPASLADAIQRALKAGEGKRHLRTWDQRAAEIEAFLQDLP